jgi:hypothetical protein
MLKKNLRFRDLLSEMIRSSVDELVQEHFGGPTQEHQLTSRICHELERTFRGAEVMGYRVRFQAQDFPDKGMGRLRKGREPTCTLGLKFSVMTLSQRAFSHNQNGMVAGGRRANRSG